MKEETTLSNQSIQSMDYEAAIQLLEEALKEKDRTLKELPQLIANLAGVAGWKTMLVHALPKGTVWIGTGKYERPDFGEPKMTPHDSLPSKNKV